eukprot:CAMPEP_0206022612 /NCGR_PEP_ID=MMETSP1464-20131121/35006_1 /ASSEMBLY_ACC=CAM_ASM_001124 /TAXON_ID=119497 /ORGANISM="Exanthemachrysis gayraliae, Strain RCC1523" /LENGTH=629 /DNA_ID=CAMNT_0053396581 /DNA_START=29 /DNA_END=1919 /DNA_ORIENTATION=-
MSAIELREKAIGYANEAVALDNEGRFEEAIAKYVQALDSFQVALKYEKAPSVSETIRAKCVEYMDRAEYLKKQLAGGGAPRVARGGSTGKGASGAADADEEDEGEGEELPPLTEDELVAAEQEMEEDLAKLVGMESVKQQMRKLCKQLALDIVRRNEGQTVLAPIRHCLFTGNPGTGKTSIARLVARLYKRLGVSRKDHVIEVQKGDLVAGYVNQTATKTAKKIKEARGGVLFVDEAYQLTQMLQRGQSDFSGEAIDEMMKVMNESGPNAVTFIFAGYVKEMGQFMAYNAGLESRIKYKFHFDDYSVDELLQILNIKLRSAGWKLSDEAGSSARELIAKETSAKLRARYNGRLVDNLFQWASDELNARVTVGARGDELVTLELADLERAVARFATSRPTEMRAGEAISDVSRELRTWGLGDYCDAAHDAGYMTRHDLQHMDEAAMKGLRMLARPADARRARAMAATVRAEALAAEMARDRAYTPAESRDVAEWLRGIGCAELAPLFARHGVDFGVLADLTYEDLKEMGVPSVGTRRRVAAAVELFKAEREASKATLLVSVAEPAAMHAPGNGPLGPPESSSMEHRLHQIKEAMGDVISNTDRRAEASSQASRAACAASKLLGVRLRLQE